MATGPRTLAIALVCAGALGNLIDRIDPARASWTSSTSAFGDMRWPTFNVADMAVSTGASCSRGCSGARTAPSARSGSAARRRSTTEGPPS